MWTTRHDVTLTVALILLVGASSSISVAHEFWIEPSSYTPKVGQRVNVALRVGEKFAGEPVRRKEDRIDRFVALAVDQASDKLIETPIAGAEGDDPAGSFLIARPGLTILIFDSNHARIELEAEKFDAYLSEKGLEAIRKQRAEHRASSQPAREMYSRCAKSLIRATDGESIAPTPGRDRAVGMPLEIVALSDPYAKSGDREGRFRILFDGKPLSDVRVTAQVRGAAEKSQSQRADRDGEVVFRLDSPGDWLVECTHMRSAPQSSDAEYESFWASLTFCVPDDKR